MDSIPGMIRPELQELPAVRERLTFIYLEHCTLNREDSAITIRDEDGVTYLPAAAISVLLLGPGTSVTHRAVELIGDAGVSMVWVGEHGVKYYAGGRPLTHRANLLIKQAKMVSNQKEHLNVVRRMYQLRFPNEDVGGLTMQQLRGREGSRVRAAYRAASKKYGVSWDGREYKVGDIDESNAVNQALTIGNACLYGLAQAVVFALGCSPGLGFIHVGHENSFVYDIADLYKAETVIPLAFELAAQGQEDILRLMRRGMRDIFASKRILERMVKDIHYLLEDEEAEREINAIYLWDNERDTVASGVSYGKMGGEAQ